MASSDSALILGGGGFIGTHLARSLLANNRGTRVVSLDIAHPKSPVEGVEYRLHDVRTPLDASVSEPFGTVYNLAAIHRTPGHQDYEYFVTNVAGALNCINYCERYRIDTVFFTSSISVYGPSARPLDESSALNPVNAYGRSKLLAENIHRAWQNRGGERRLVIARPAIVFGEGENGNYTRLVKILRSGLFVFPGRRDTRKAGGYVKELVRTIDFALNRREPLYAYNFAGRVCPTLEDICRTLHEVAEVRRPLANVPSGVLSGATIPFELLNAIGIRNSVSRERVAKLIYSTYIVPRRLMSDGYDFKFDLADALRDWIASDPSLGVRVRKSGDKIDAAKLSGGSNRDASALQESRKVA